MNIKKLLLLVFATLTIYSCSDSFVDDPAPVDGVSEALVFSNRSMVDAFIAGMGRRIRAQFQDTGNNGINGMYYARVVKGNDVIQRRTWFTFDYENDNREPNYRRTRFTWQFPFYMINQANIAIKGINESDLGATDKAETLAQVHSIRAFWYFQLALEFCPAYLHTNPATTDAPPLYTEPVSEGGPMSTLAEVYDLIQSDFETALTLASTSRIDKSYINKNVIHGFLARFYLTTGEYAKAASNAAAARQGYTLDRVGYRNGFSDMSNSEWIWAAPQRSDQSNYYWGPPHAHADHYVTSYAATFFNTEFTDLFRGTIDYRNMFLNGYRAPETDYRARISRKWSFSFSSDHSMMRSPEMMLIEAEGLARTGNEAGARALLEGLQGDRIIGNIPSGATGSALIEEILVERRKELYGEPPAVEWFDAKRLGRGITRTGNHRVKGNASLDPNDKRFYLKVPQFEIDANPNITDAVNANR
ncbi:RagB/SusD family nutrient uptake outer membrane protein [Flavobacteriales bacterium]|nr:RagB/SusD family nutrient uptake outer membrane protein [Flavobacteriales bacterium]